MTNKTLQIIRSTCLAWAVRTGEETVAYVDAGGSIHYQIAKWPIQGKEVCRCK